MQDLNQRRDAALEYHRREYERTHPHQFNQVRQQQQQQHACYQTDSLVLDEDGEDEID